MGLLAGCIIPSFLSGILYCTDSGLYFLDVIDFYVNFVMLLVGFLEAFGAAWAYGILDQYSTVGVKATLSYMMANFVPILVVSFSYSSKAWVSFVAAIGVGVFGLAVTHYFLVKRMKRQPGRWTLRSIWFECAFGNICRLRDQIQPNTGRIPFIWVILMKNLVPHTCIVLFISLLISPDAGNFGGLAIQPYQLLGILCFLFAIFIFFVGLFVPEVYVPLALPQTKVILSGANESEERETDDIEYSGRGSLHSVRNQ